MHVVITLISALLGQIKSSEGQEGLPLVPCSLPIQLSFRLQIMGGLGDKEVEVWGSAAWTKALL